MTDHGFVLDSIESAWHQLGQPKTDDENEIDHSSENTCKARPIGNWFQAKQKQVTVYNLQFFRWEWDDHVKKTFVWIDASILWSSKQNQERKNHA